MPWWSRTRLARRGLDGSNHQTFEPLEAKGGVAWVFFNNQHRMGAFFYTVLIT